MLYIIINRDVEYKKYDTTTQIVALPGGVKRSHCEINDDSKFASGKVNQSYSTKLHRDYKSNISCLPGSMINGYNERQKHVNIKKYQTNDIFNTNSNTYTNYNTFKVSNRKPESSFRVFGQSQDEKKLIPNPKAHRPENIKNPFISQIQIC
jgi:hypothetical protein